MINEKCLQTPTIIEGPLTVRSATMNHFYERGYKFFIQGSQNMLLTKRKNSCLYPLPHLVATEGARYSLTH
jgi:hypothetical protein